jgi:hypothetical protein
MRGLSGATTEANMARKRKNDFTFQNHGSICILEPVTRRAKAWAQEFILQNEETQYWGAGIVVEPRYIDDIIAGLFGDGLTVA